MVWELAFEIANYLSKYQRKGGLEDPLEKKILKNCYGTEFYSLLCALIFKRTNQEVWKERAIRALTSSLLIRKNRYNIKGIFRWEFKNYTLIKLYSLLRNDLNEELKKQLIKAIKSWRNLGSFQTNWAAMRALNYILRYKEFGSPLDFLKSKSNLCLVLKRQDKEGFFPDDLKSYTSQYHAYILALLYQCYELTGDKKVKEAFLRGVDFIIGFLDSQGDFNYFGRGKGQIFGYASMIFALYGAAKIKNDGYYVKIAEKILSYVSKFVNKKNNYPIVLNKDEKKREGWYPYNHKSDYLPFFSFYLLLASEIKTRKLKQSKPVQLKRKSKKEPYEKKAPFLRCFVYYIEKFVHFTVPHFINFIFFPREFWLTLKYRKKHDVE